MHADAADIKVIQEKLEQFINRLAINSETDGQQFVNIVSGRVVVVCHDQVCCPIIQSSCRRGSSGSLEY